MKTYQQDDNTRIDIRLLSIYQLMRWNESGILKTDLSWNRGFHWNQEQKGKMIDSILTGIPLQTIFLKENSREMEVIDGVQRIKTILGFLNDEFPVLSENEKWNGCTYSQLKSIDQRKIEDFQVPAYILHDDESGEMAIRIFQNLNIRRTAFTSQEIRNYLYADQGMPYVEKLSKNNYFQKTIQNKEIDFATHQEYELVLRFMSFYYKGYENYTGNIKKFMDDTLEHYEKYRATENVFASIFEEVFHSIWNIWGKEAFVVTSPKKRLNLAMFDVITYSFAKYNRNHILNNRDQIRALPEKLLDSDNAFRKAVTGVSATSTGNVKRRFAIWMKEMERVLGEKHD